MKVAVLGFGRQGKIVAHDMARTQGVSSISVVDLDLSKEKDNDFAPYHYIEADLSNYKSVRKICEQHDLAIGCLPAKLGHNAMFAIVDAGIHYVDLSFLEQDYMSFDSSALHKKITIIPDAGIAPGLSNLVVGRAMLNKPKRVEIHVGGIAHDKAEDYVISWSPEDLEEEYVRPARIIQNGLITTVPPLSGEENLIFPNIGRFNSYYTDGLRSLLDYQGQVDFMAEKTIRWPGHIEKVVNPLLKSGNFVEGITSKFKSSDEAQDMLIMLIKADDEEVTLKVDGGLESAMSQCTAHACSSFAALIASGTFPHTGVLPAERVARHDAAYKFVLDKMSEHGVNFSTKYPFM